MDNFTATNGIEFAHNSAGHLVCLVPWGTGSAEHGDLQCTFRSKAAFDDQALEAIAQAVEKGTSVTVKDVNGEPVTILGRLDRAARSGA